MPLRYISEATGLIVDKVEIAMERFKAFEPEDGYYLAFSGGKDSQCIYHLAKDAGVKFDAHYAVTSVDPPELVRFIKSHYPDVSIDIPHDKDGKPITMWSLIPQYSMPPTRQVRYCCAKLKEAAGKGRITVTGVRWAESARRRSAHDVVGIQGKRAMNYHEKQGGEVRTDRTGKRLIMNDDNDVNRRTVEHCYRTAKTMLNPIVDWTDEDVWEYLNEVKKVEHCCLYDEGWHRIGCIGCPMQSIKQREEEFVRWPAYKRNYIKAFERMIANNSARAAQTCDTPPLDVTDAMTSETMERMSSTGGSEAQGAATVDSSYTPPYNVTGSEQPIRRTESTIGGSTESVSSSVTDGYTPPVQCNRKLPSWCYESRSSREQELRNEQLYGAEERFFWWSHSGIHSWEWESGKRR